MGKTILIVAVLIFCNAPFNICSAMFEEEGADTFSSSVKKLEISKEDIKNLITAFHGEAPFHVMTVRINPQQSENILEEMTTLYDLSKKEFLKITTSDLSDTLKEEFVESLKDTLSEYKARLFKIVPGTQSSLDLNTVIKIGRVVNEYQPIFEKFFNDKIKENILKQRELCQGRIKAFFKELEEQFQYRNFKGHILIVMQEAFLNYFENPAGIGNFLPFEETDYKLFREELNKFSTNHKNVLFIPNILYGNPISAYSPYEENFIDLIKHSYSETQKIVERFNNLRASEVKETNAMHNKSFLFWKGHHFFEYQKQYILDTDIPLEYFPSYFYVPGSKYQEHREGIGKYFSIDICQDHIRKAYLEGYSPTSTFYIVQSATLPLETTELRKKRYTGVLIHADAKNERNEVLSYLDGKEKALDSMEEAQNINSTFLFKTWDLHDTLNKHYLHKKDTFIETILKKIQEN